MIVSNLLTSVLIYLAIEGRLRYMILVTPAIFVIAGIGLLSVLLISIYPIFLDKVLVAGFVQY